MVNWKCKHCTTTSAKKCIDFGHKDCLIEMCEKNNIQDIEKINIGFNKKNLCGRYNNCSVDILSYLCELAELEMVKLLIEKYHYNPNNTHSPLRGYEYLLASVCYGHDYDVFLYLCDYIGTQLSYLIWPCIYGNLDILNYILDNLQIKENSCVKELQNGLFHAISRNHIHVVEFLFDKYNLTLYEENMLYYSQYSNNLMWKLLIKKKNPVITEKIIKYAKKYNKDKSVSDLMFNHTQ